MAIEFHNLPGCQLFGNLGSIYDLVSDAWVVLTIRSTDIGHFVPRNFAAKAPKQSLDNFSNQVEDIITTPPPPNVVSLFVRDTLLQRLSGPWELHVR